MRSSAVLTLELGGPILVEGLARGFVSTADLKLSDFFNSESMEWIEARMIVNPGTTLRRAAITGTHAKTIF
jgi:hypothetical protein